MSLESVFSGVRAVRLRRLVLALLAVPLCAGVGVSVGYAQSGPRDRIVQPLDNRTFSLASGNLHGWAQPKNDLGQLDPATRLGRVTMFFSRTPQQQADLDSLLAEQQDRSSPNYHRWLSPEDFAARFGLSQGDMDKIVTWLQGRGLTIEQVSRGRTWVAFSGSAAQVGAALRTDLHRYAAGGETHFAMSREPSLPSAMAGVVLGFRGLDDLRLKPRAVKVRSRFTSGQTGFHFLAPGDLATIYNLTPLYNANVDGHGQSLVVVGQTAINVSDVQNFRSLSGLPVNNPTPMLIPGATDPGIVDGEVDEANLDLDLAGAVAPKAAILYVYTDPNAGQGVIDAFNYAIDQNLAPVLSISYGACETSQGQSEVNTLASEAQKANAEGITIIAPSGDSGAADCDSGPSNQTAVATQGLAVDAPGALPFVTAVGGTSFSADIANPGAYWSPFVMGTDVPNSAVSYIPETSWNDTDASGLGASGGGSSNYFAKPSWQTGAGVPMDGARDVPDVSFNASANHDGYLVCSEDNSSGSFQPTCVSGFRNAPPPNGTFTVFGGTSAGVPILAGIVTLINQQANSPAGQGNVNPHLYAMANTASRASFFNDVTTGNNAVPFQPANLAQCTPAGTVALGYVAGAGYDLVTGLGSVNAANLVNNWTAVAVPAAGANITTDFALSISPATLTVKRNACGSAAVTLTRPNGFAGTPVFTCAAAAPLTAVTCSVSPVASGAAPMPAPEKLPAGRWWPAGMLIVAMGFWAETIRRWRSSPRGRLAPGLALAGLLAVAIGCGGSSSGSSSTASTTPTSKYVFIVDAPPSASVGTAAVTVTGSIGGVTRTTQMTVTVN